MIPVCVCSCRKEKKKKIQFLPINHIGINDHFQALSLIIHLIITFRGSCFINIIKYFLSIVYIFRFIPKILLLNVMSPFRLDVVRQQ